MKPKSKTRVAVVLGFAFTLTGCGVATGACTRTMSLGNFGSTTSCGDDQSLNTCNLVLGTGWTEGVTCADLGFRVTDGSENPTTGGITGV